MKRFCILFTASVMLGAVIGHGDDGEPGRDPYAHITQDRIDLNLANGDLQFNKEAVDKDTLAEGLKQSYSIYLNAFCASFEDMKQVPSGDLRAVLEMMEIAGIDPALVRLNLNLAPISGRHHFTIGLLGGGKADVEGKEISITEFDVKKFQKVPVFITQHPAQMNVDYRDFLALLHELGSNVQLAGLGLFNLESVAVEARISQIKPDGSQDVLSAPKVTTKEGNSALIRVVENASGRTSYPLGTDEFHQEDLANLGIRFSATPQIIGEYLRVSGVAILTKLGGREAVFLDEDIPIASYSCTKIVVPFSVVFPPGRNVAEFAIAEIDGDKAMCRLEANRVDERGMTREQRQRAKKPAQ